MTIDFKTISNGEAISIESIPHLSFEDFSNQAIAIVSGGGKVVQFFAFQADTSVRLMCVLRTEELLVASCDAPERYPALTTRCEPFHMFEREIAEQYGIRFIGPNCIGVANPHHKLNTSFIQSDGKSGFVGLASQIERVGAGLMMAVPVIGLITRMPATGFMVFLGGMGTLCIPLVVHLITLPTEFDASFRRAMPLLVEGEYIPPEDIPAARRILWACSLTYVASALVGLLNIWRWIRVLRR